MISKKTMTIGLLILTLAFLIGCSKNQNKQEIKDNEIIEEEKPKDPITDNNEKETKDIMNEFYSLIEQNTELEGIIQFVDDNISLVPMEDSTVMIQGLEETQKNHLVKLESKFYTSESIMGKLNDIYLAGLNINDSENIEDEVLKAFLIQIKANGYKIEAAEGMYFPVISYEFYEPYSFYLSQDMKDYIKIMAIESNQVPAKDAALVIGWEEVIERILNQERFIKDYPNSSKLEDIKELHEKYLMFAFFGLDNTPLFNYDSKAIKSDAKREYKKAIAESGDSEFLNHLENFMEILKENKYKLTDEAEIYRKNVI